MSFNHNVTPVAWNELSLDMPFSTPNASSEDEAFNTPGCCLKSIERAPGRPPTHFGRLHSVSEEQVIVMAMRHAADDPTWVWTGSRADYYDVWRCD
jgi:hypothetical protein